MKLDAELMFECLIYLNAYYYAVFATCQSIMSCAKYISHIDTPYIGRDASVTFAVLLCEFLKISLYRKFKDDRRDLVTAIAVLLTGVTIFGFFYTVFYQCPVLKLEYILGALTIMLAGSEVTFGILQILPCCKKVQYY